jgi:hypothetical protein
VPTIRFIIASLARRSSPVYDAGVNGDPGQTPQLPVAFRLNTNQWVGGLAMIVIGLVIISGLGAAADWAKIPCVALFLALVLYGVRTIMLGAFAEADRLVVRNYFSTHQIRWPEIARFEYQGSSQAGSWRKSGLKIHLSDGRLISVSAYSPIHFYDSSSAGRQAVEELEALRQALSGSDTTASEPSPDPLGEGHP